ncbi:MAG: hypothetical protein EBW87_00825 [Burkholderiaceae bacterium]|nr:hypothetical protein [Burkholderiaceae bacterium]
MSKRRQAFAHGIQVVPRESVKRRKNKRPSRNCVWQHKALNTMRMRFYFQVLKAEIKIKRKWSNNYCIKRIGVPGRAEFLCRETFYVASMIEQREAEKFRAYWIQCYRKSLEILNWLWRLDHSSYSWRLHLYLRSLIVTSRPILSEVERYESRTREEITSEIFGKWGDIVQRAANKETLCDLQKRFEQQ